MLRELNVQELYEATEEAMEAGDDTAVIVNVQLLMLTCTELLIRSAKNIPEEASSVIEQAVPILDGEFPDVVSNDAHLAGAHAFLLGMYDGLEGSKLHDDPNYMRGHALAYESTEEVK